MSDTSLSCDVLVIGGGAAGLSAALAARDGGAEVLIVEREAELGGILNQCIHNGFGLHRFGEELTGPEFAARDIEPLLARDKVEVRVNTSVLGLERRPEGGIHAQAVGPDMGFADIEAKAVVLACGCRERTRGQINIAGSRPAGVFTAGSAQKIVNCDGGMVGREVVILGSGDIGLIMARRMTWEGAHVICVCELASEPGGLRRNIVQCLEDNNIPLYLSTTVTQVFGKDRLEAVELADVDPATLRPIPGTERRVACDTLLLSVGLIPENELAKLAGVSIDPRTSGPLVDETLATDVPGIFVAGNELHVHDLADFVSEEGEQAGRAAAAYALAQSATSQNQLQLEPGEGVGSLTPQRLSPEAEEVTVRLRSTSRIEGAQLVVSCGDEQLRKLKRQVVVPSEMQSIKLKAHDIARAAELGGTITVSCEKS